MTIRIIPRLDIKGPNLVKGIHLEGLRVLGKPERFAKRYYDQGADELFFQDIVASLYERNTLAGIIECTAKDIFIPMTVGGGIRTIEDINTVLRAGADKVSINTAAIRNPGFIREASLKFGSSTIMVAIEAIRQPDGSYLCYIDNGREHTGAEAVQWAQKIESLGAGEIVITSVDQEGTGLGFDMELTKMVAESVSIPVIAHGGARSPEDVLNVIKNCNIHAVAIASLFHYHDLENMDSAADRYDEGNLSFIKSRRSFNKIESCSIQEIKTYLKDHSIEVR